MTKSPEEIVLPVTGCPEKNAPQFLLNFSDYKHAKKIGHFTPPHRFFLKFAFT